MTRKKRFPNHAIIASLMVEPKQEKWHEIVKRVEDVGVDGLELNFGCPHGMAERGMALPLVKSLNWLKSKRIG